MFLQKMTNSTQSLRPNPLPSIVAALPDKLSILDAPLFDRLQNIVKSTTGKLVNTQCIVVLLTALAEEELIYMKEVPSDIDGTLLILRKK